MRDDVVIDETRYILLVSSFLTGFKKSSPQTWTCRCPLCGDSSRDKKKTRGHFYPARGRPGYVFHCYNCGEHMFLGTFLKKVAPSLFSEMMSEKFGVTKRDTKPKVAHPKTTPPAQPLQIVEDVGLWSRLRDVATPVPELPATHIAHEYLASRRLPVSQWGHLLFASNYAAVANLSDKYRGRIKAEPRLIIPTFSRRSLSKPTPHLVAVTGRCLDEKGSRYVDIAFDETDPNIFGADRIDPNRRVYVVEGQMDAMFLPNAVAVGSSNLRRAERIGVSRDRMVLIPDLQPRNAEIRKGAATAIREGFAVALLPRAMSGARGKDKDINDYVKAGYSVSEILDIIDRHTFSGIQAELELAGW